MVNCKNILGLLMISTLFFSCKEETRVNTVEGRLFHDCSFPLGGTEVAFKVNKGGSFNEPLILATDICESNGYFRFTYELEEDKSGTADLIIVEKEGYSAVLEQVSLNKDHQLTARRNNLSTVIFTYAGNKVFQATDTLFYGIQAGSETFTVQPLVGFRDTLYTKMPNTINPKRWVAFYYGVGINDFNLSKEALNIQDSTYNYFYLEVEGCNDLDQFDLQIN